MLFLMFKGSTVLGSSCQHLKKQTIDSAISKPVKEESCQETQDNFSPNYFLVKLSEFSSVDWPFKLQVWIDLHSCNYPHMGSTLPP